MVLFLWGGWASEHFGGGDLKAIFLFRESLVRRLVWLGLEPLCKYSSMVYEEDDGIPHFAVTIEFEM